MESEWRCCCSHLTWGVPTDLFLQSGWVPPMPISSSHLLSLRDRVQTHPFMHVWHCILCAVRYRISWLTVNYIIIRESQNLHYTVRDRSLCELHRMNVTVTVTYRTSYTVTDCITCNNTPILTVSYCMTLSHGQQ